MWGNSQAVIAKCTVVGLPCLCKQSAPHHSHNLVNFFQIVLEVNFILKHGQLARQCATRYQCRHEAASQSCNAPQLLDETFGHLLDASCYVQAMQVHMTYIVDGKLLLRYSFCLQQQSGQCPWCQQLHGLLGVLDIRYG